jgi:tetratricopeptide (TPR) repeat protein
MNKNTIWALALGISLVTAGMQVAPTHAATRIYKAGASYTREFRNADSYLQTGQYQAAESKYLSLLKTHPSSVTYRASAAMAQAELFKLDAAEKNANMVLSKSPRNAMAHMTKGIVDRNRTASLDMTYKSQRDDLLAKSASELQQAISYDPKSPEAHNQLGIT